ncbi:MAG: hypothetical protein JNK22_16785 [Rhodocyclaceae bacterium]|nr:hypothetical protein [Rhodocyclaceae bacterium]
MSPPSRSTDAEAKRRLARWIAERFFVRFHALLILAFTFACGLLAGRVALAWGLESPLLRYPLGVCAAYLGFLLAVRIWLAYAGFGRQYKRRRDEETDAGDVDFSGAGRGKGEPAPEAGQCGDGGLPSDGAGAPQGEWSLPEAPGLGDLGGDEGCLVAALPLLALFVLAAALSGALYAIGVGAPMLLAEAALEAAMAAGFFGSLRRVDNPGWMGGALRASFVYFLVVLGAAFLLALAVGAVAPGARTLGEALRGA